MKRQVLAVALGTVFALPALANNEISTGYVSQPQSTMQRSIEMFIDAEQGYALQAAAEQMSRAEVVAEVTKARSTGDYIVNAELGTKASRL
ncbi:MAG TPA: hypothetical protein VLA30_05035 [Burkholderiales bacterium]|nr:hypothetical protein [Burkholderiales bacterium]